MDIKGTLNKLKWQLYMRLPGGGIYETCKSRLYNNDDDLFNKILNGSYLNQSILHMFIKGYYSVEKKDIYNFYKLLLESKKVIVLKEDNCLFMEFNIMDNLVKIPVPDFSNINELASYRFELLDLIFPYLVTDISGFDKIPFNEGPYEYKGKTVNIQLSDNDVVLDLGANFGMFSAYAASKGCEVYSFEPLKNAVERYLEELQKTYPNIHVVNKAVSNKVGNALLSVDDTNYGGSSIIDVNRDGKNSVVSTTTIDQFVSDNNINRLDFIKADIEGAECDMLEGARYTLRYFHPDLSLCKYHNLGDYSKMKKLVLDANPNYKIESKWKKLYGQVK